MAAQKPQSSRKSKNQHPTPSTAHSKTEILINVYDLLSPGILSSILWHVGSSLLHTGVVIPCLDREYAFGGHNHPNISGVYWTKPRTLPPGGTWRCELLQGFTLRTKDEIEEVVQDAGRRFLGNSYNLLSNNCNHFTDFLCEKLVGKAPPGWLNRAASIGVALPCVVPREWVASPDADAMDGELVNEEDNDEEEDERTSMLRQDYRRARDNFHESSVEHGTDDRREIFEGNRHDGANWKGKGVLRDSEGRAMPSTEWAPTPRMTS